jgi:hypothetical protein
MNAAVATKPRLKLSEGAWYCTWRPDPMRYYYGIGLTPLAAFEAMCLDIRADYTGRKR